MTAEKKSAGSGFGTRALLLEGVGKRDVYSTTLRRIWVIRRGAL